MAEHRTYGQSCRIAQSLDLIGERWTLLLARELLLGPRRFSELEANLPGIGTNLLAARLKSLQSHGLIEQRKVDSQSKRKAYALSPLGQGLEATLRELMRWAVCLPPGVFADADVYRPEWDLVALKLLYRPKADIQGRLLLRIEEKVLPTEVSAEGLRFPSEVEFVASATLSADRETWRQLAFGLLSSQALIDQGKLATSGDHTLACRWAARFRAE